MTNNFLTGYPECVDLRYFAASYHEKQKRQKLQEKLLITTSLDEEFFQIKRKPRKLNVFITEDNLYQICKICFKKEKDQYLSNPYYVNILDVDQLFALRESPICSFKYLRLLFTKNDYCININKNTLHNKEISDFLKEYEKLKARNAVDKSPSVTYPLMFGWLKKALDKFAYRFSAVTFKIVGIIFYLFSHKYMQRLIVSSNEIRAIRKEYESSLPIVYIVKNQCFIDWFLIMFVLVFGKLKPPVVLLHGNINSILHWIYKKCGVIFIQPRRADLYLEDPKSIVYDEAWLIYLEEHLKTGNHLMFNLQSPNGKIDEYLLETILDSIRRRAITDLLITPVIVSYEKKPNKFTEEFSKKSFWMKIIDLLWTQKYYFGFVKINFLQPVSLKGMMSALKGKTENIYQMSQNDNAVLTTKVASHIAYDFCRAQPVMSTSLISFLLLKKFRTGVTYNNLIAEVDEIRSDLKYMRKQLGFTGNSGLVINHAARILGPKLVNFSCEPSSKSMIKPLLKIPNVFETMHYANDTLGTFLMNGVVMTSVAVKFKEELKTAFKDSVELKFSYRDIIDKATELCDILQFEYQFEKPCQSLQVELEAAFYRFANDNMFTKVETCMTEEEQWARRFASQLEDDNTYSEDEYDTDISLSSPLRISGDDDVYTVNLQCEKSVFKEIMFYRNFLKPIIDTYAACAENLNMLVGQQVLDYIFHEKLINKLTIMFNKNELVYAESLSPELIQNSMNLFEKWQVVISYSIAKIRLYYLSDTYNNSSKQLSSVIDKIKNFKL